MRKVRFPKISANVDEATITRWAVAEGDEVSEGDLLLEITTDKGVVEMESPCAGTLMRIVAPENSTLPVGYVIALIGAPGETVPEVDTQNRALMERHVASAVEVAKPTRQVVKGERTRVRATPAARRLARDHGFDLAAVQATLAVDVVNEAAIREFIERGNG